MELPLNQLGFLLLSSPPFAAEFSLQCGATSRESTHRGW